jgi:putative peptide zinc metalloprotease protein
MSEVVELMARIPRFTMQFSVSSFDCADLVPKYLLMREDGRSWKISEEVMRIVREIDQRSDIRAIADRALYAIDHRMSREDVTAVISVLLVHMGIVDPGSVAAVASHAALPGGRRRSSLLWRVPLLPPAATNVLAAALAPLCTRGIGIPVGIAALCVHCWWMLQPAWTGAAAQEMSGAEWMAALGLLIGSFFLHELGHMAAARRLSGSAGEIGFGVYLIFPVLYANVTATWKLPRAQRAFVDLAGIYFQLVFSALLIVHGHFAYHPAIGSAVIGIDISCVANLNPFLRLDGYWFLSDVTGVANLNLRIRELLRSKGRAPAGLSPRTTRLLWIYGLLSGGFWCLFMVWTVKYVRALIDWTLCAAFPCAFKLILSLSVAAWSGAAGLSRVRHLLSNRGCFIAVAVCSVGGAPHLGFVDQSARAESR